MQYTCAHFCIHVCICASFKPEPCGYKLSIRAMVQELEGTGCALRGKIWLPPPEPWRELPGASGFPKTGVSSIRNLPVKWVEVK